MLGVPSLPKPALFFRRLNTGPLYLEILLPHVVT
jgi:hypothetical protein